MSGQISKTEFLIRYSKEIFPSEETINDLIKEIQKNIKYSELVSGTAVLYKGHKFQHFRTVFDIDSKCKIIILDYVADHKVKPIIEVPKGVHLVKP